MTVTTYKCYTDDGPITTMSITRQNSRQARYAYFLAVSEYLNIRYIDVKAKSQRRVLEDREVLRIAQYRNVPFVRNGMRCEVVGKMGHIVGAGGGGCYLQVQFDTGEVLYFHPQGDRCRFFDAEGNEIKNDSL